MIYEKLRIFCQNIYIMEFISRDDEGINKELEETEIIGTSKFFIGTELHGIYKKLLQLHNEQEQNEDYDGVSDVKLIDFLKAMKGAIEKTLEIENMLPEEQEKMKEFWEENADDKVLNTLGELNKFILLLEGEQGEGFTDETSRQKYILSQDIIKKIREKEGPEQTFDEKEKIKELFKEIADRKLKFEHEDPPSVRRHEKRIWSLVLVGELDWELESDKFDNILTSLIHDALKEDIHDIITDNNIMSKESIERNLDFEGYNNKWFLSHGGKTKRKSLKNKKKTKKSKKIKKIKNRKTRKEKKTRKGRKQKGSGTTSSREEEVVDTFEGFLEKRTDLKGKENDEQLREFIKYLYSLLDHDDQANALKIHVYNKFYGDYDAETKPKTPPRSKKTIKDGTPGKVERGESPRPIPSPVPFYSVFPEMSETKKNKIK